MNYLLVVLRMDFLVIAASIGTFFFAMSDAVTISIASSLATTVLGVVTAYFAYRAKVFAAAAEKAVNGITHEMIAQAKLASHAEGKLVGKTEAELAAAKIQIVVAAAEKKP